MIVLVIIVIEVVAVVAVAVVEVITLEIIMVVLNVMIVAGCSSWYQLFVRFVVDPRLVSYNQQCIVVIDRCM